MPGYLGGNQLVLDTPPSAQPETQETMEIRLRELNRIRNTNTKRYKMLLAKWRRKEERIRLRREPEDSQIAAIQAQIDAIHAARARKDNRIRMRRVPQDEAFDILDRSIHQEYSVYYCVVAPLVLPLTGSVGSSIQVPPSKDRPSPG